MRHTFVSTLIVDEKEDNATVMAISGHKDMRMLQRYSHTWEEAKKSAIYKPGNRLKSAAIDTYSDTSDTN
jgi:integrase